MIDFHCVFFNMARIVRRKNYTYKKQIILFFLLLAIYLLSSLLLEIKNTEILIKYQTMQKEISLLEEENTKLSIEIEQLKKYKRVKTIAEDADLKIDISNVIFIP